MYCQSNVVREIPIPTNPGMKTYFEIEIAKVSSKVMYVFNCMPQVNPQH